MASQVARHQFSSQEAAEAARKRWGQVPPRNTGLEDSFGIHTLPPVDFPAETPPKKDKIQPLSITYNGQTKTLRQWAREKGMSYSVLYSRIKHGWPTDLAMDTKTDRANHWLMRKHLKEMG